MLWRDRNIIMYVATQAQQEHNNITVTLFHWIIIYVSLSFMLFHWIIIYVRNNIFYVITTQDSQLPEAIGTMAPASRVCREIKGDGEGNKMRKGKVWKFFKMQSPKTVAALATFVLWYFTWVTLKACVCFDFSKEQKILSNLNRKLHHIFFQIKLFFRV